MQLHLNRKNAFALLIIVSFTYLAYLIWSREERPPPFTVELHDLISYVVLAIEMGGQAVALIQKEGGSIGIETKGNTDVGKAELLTKADLVSNHLMVGLLRRLPLLDVC